MNFENAESALDGIQERYFIGGVSRDAVSLVEKGFDLEFPADYVEYLTNLGCGFASSEDFLGLGGEPHLDVVRTYNRLREHSKHTQLPANYVPLKPDGYGNYECIDVGNSSGGKSLIVLWLHDGGDEQKCQVIADGFWRWFTKEIESIQEFDKQGN